MRQEDCWIFCMSKKSRNVIDVIANIEIFIGVIFLAYSLYSITDFYLLNSSDRHGYGLLGFIYFGGLGGLFGFAGLVLKLNKWYSVILQVVLLIHCYFFILQFLDLL
jgi:hypothetical protein